VGGFVVWGEGGGRGPSEDRGYAREPVMKHRKTEEKHGSSKKIITKTDKNITHKNTKDRGK